MKKQMIVTLIAALLLSGTAMAKSGNVDNGESIYMKRCVFCHGEEGDGMGPGEEYMSPPPRDFTSGMYKIKSSAFDDDIAYDDDIYRMIAEGMPGTVMPGWKDVISKQDMWDLVAYLKVFAEMEGMNGSKQVDYGTEVPSSEESLKKGKDLFVDRCAECHGDLGKGDANKAMKDDNGYRTWPRNLTKPWTFIASNSAKDIYTRISVGIPGTQMPNFANPKSKKKLSTEERWHIANFVVSIIATEKTPKGENTVVKAERVEGELPKTVDDDAWALAEPTAFLMLPQLVVSERFFKYVNDSVVAKALYNDKDISFLIEWDDRTKSVPGDAIGAKLAEGEMFTDGMAMQFPVEVKETEKPYFVYGDGSNPVNLWKWNSESTTDSQQMALINATAFDKQEERDIASIGLSGNAVYKNGTWRLIMTRSLTTDDPEKDIQFEEGKFTPLAFMAWDGSNGERGTSQTISTWYWLLLKPSASSNVYIVPLVVMLIVFGVLIWWAATVGKKKST